MYIVKLSIRIYKILKIKKYIIFINEIIEYSYSMFEPISIVKTLLNNFVLYPYTRSVFLISIDRMRYNLVLLLVETTN